MRTAPLLTSLLAVLAIAASAAPARADDGSLPDQPKPDDSASKRTIDRTWLYADDARIPAPMTVIGMTNLSYTGVGASPTRVDSPYPNTYKNFAGNTAQPGAMLGVGGEVGLLPRLSVVAMGQMGFGGVDSVPSPSAGAIAGLRLQLLPPEWQHTRLVVSGGYLREAWSGPVFNDDTGKWLPGAPNGDNGAWVQAAFSGDIQRLRLATTIHGEHVFWNGRDPLDVMVSLGASYRVAGAFRLGAEYVGQDLEELAAPAAEAGARHFVGPTASMQLLQGRLTMVAGPAVGLSAYSPTFLGRIAVAYGF
jgi:hypothetical protein